MKVVCDHCEIAEKRSAGQHACRQTCYGLAADRSEKTRKHVCLHFPADRLPLLEQEVKAGVAAQHSKDLLPFTGFLDL